jgi:hypothetical protein
MRRVNGQNVPKRAPKAEIRRYFGGRVRALGVAVVLALLGRLATPGPPERSVDGVAAFLGERSETRVAGADIAWEPSDGTLSDLTRGRGVVFLGIGETGMRDVFRARVRLTPGGQPLSLASLMRITRTPLADEAGLHVDGSRVAFATLSDERVRAVTVLELDGPRADDLPGSRFERGLSRMRAFLGLGIWHGIGRTDIVFERPLTRLALRTRDGVLELRPDDAERALRYDLATRSLRGDDARAAHVLHRVEPRVPLGALERLRPALASGDITQGGAPFLFETKDVEGSSIELVTFDMRRLELGFQAGVATPSATLGPPGAGRLPKRLLPKVVAVFAAGAEAHGAMSDGRLLAPAVHRAPTVAVSRLGDAAIGAFPWEAASDPGLESFVQLPGLPLDGKAPSSEAAAEATRRSALCITQHGQLVYAFSRRASRSALAHALSVAECREAVELTHASETAGFAATRFGADGTVARFSLASAGMTLRPEDVLRGSANGFFYLLDGMSRAPSDPGVDWKPSPGTQPGPALLPGVFEATDRLGALSVKVLSFERSSVSFRVRPGWREPGARNSSWAGVFAKSPAGESLAAFGLGHSTEVTRYGLRLGSNVPLLLKGGYATLVLADGRAPRIALPTETLTLAGDEEAVQLPLLADENGIDGRARERGSFRRRSALGLAPGGRVLVAELEHDSSDPLAVTLRRLGCTRVVELDRGSHHPAFVFRAQQGSAPPPPSDATVLHLFSRAIPPRTLSSLEAVADARPSP